MNKFHNRLLELSVERVALLAQQNALPVPDINLDTILASAFGAYPSSSETPRIPIVRGYSADDPWTLPSQPSGTISNGALGSAEAEAAGASSLAHGAPSNFSGTGLPKYWWKKQETVFVNVLGQQGFLLNRYLVYEISSDVSLAFILLSLVWSCLDCLPLRLLLERTACPETILGICVLVGLSRETLSVQADSGASTETSWA